MKASSIASNETPPAVEIARSSGAVPTRRTGTALISAASSGASISAKRSGRRRDRLVQQADGGRRQIDRLAQERRQRLLVARRFETLLQFRHRQIRTQRDVQHRFARRRDGFAQRRRQRIDAAAFEPLPGDRCASPRTDCPPNDSSIRFSGWPSKRSRNTSDQLATKPQFAGRSGATAMPAFASTSTQPPSEPSRGQLAPPSASTTASA